MYNDIPTTEDITDFETCDACGERPCRDPFVGLCYDCEADVGQRAIEDRDVYLETLNQQHAAEMRAAA